MTTATVATSTSVGDGSFPRTTVVTNLFQIPTGACSLAVSMANAVTERGGGTSAVATNAVMLAQPVPNPDIAGQGVSGILTHSIMITVVN